MASLENNGSTRRPRIIGIDGGTWSNRRGYGRFLRQLLPEVVKLRPDWRFVVFLDQDQPDLFDAPNLQWITARTARSVAESAAADNARSAADLFRMTQAVNRVKLDLFFFPTIYSYFPITRLLPIVVGIHDTMADHFPQWAFAGKQQEVLWRAKVWMALAQARHIVTVSEYSSQSIQETHTVDEDRITVVSEAAAPIFRPLGLPEQPVLLAVGGISPNKNLDVVIRAMDKLRHEFPALRLVLVGDYQHDGFQNCYADWKNLVTQLHLEEQVRFAGYVSDDELVTMYNQAMAFVMPSLEEGFGLPLAEAMACGCPAIVSRGHALEEIGGDAVLLADPGSVDEWVEQLRGLLRDPAQRQTMRTAALKRSKHFTWQRGAQSLADLFQKLLGA